MATKVIYEDYARNVARTIWSQIWCGGQNIVMSWGVSKLSFAFHHENPALVMWVNGFQFQGAVIVALNVMDTYDIYFMKDGKEVHKIEDIYFDQLTDVIDRYVEVGNLTEEQYKEKIGKWLVDTALL